MSLLPPVAAAVTPLASRRRPLLHHLLLVAAAVTPLAPPASAQPKLPTAAPDVRATAPIKNFRLPTFTDEGYRSTTLRAGEARIISNDRIEVFGVEFVLYTEDALEQTDTIITTPFAVALPSQSRLEGNDTVHLKRSDIELTGANWSYTHRETEEHVTVNRDAHLIFKEEFKDIIK